MSKPSLVLLLLAVVSVAQSSDISIDDLNVDQLLSTIENQFETVWWDLDYSDTCNAAEDRQLGASPKCSAQYPDFADGVLCYENCPAGHSTRYLRDCYKDCQEGWADQGLICHIPLQTVAKESYPRGGSKPMVEGCGSGKEFYGGFCYDKCSSGYFAKGVICFESGCPSGFADNGETCYKFPDIYWKKSYTRTGAVVPSYQCPSSHPDKIGALCYQRCNSGYSGDAINCYKYCPHGSIDRGLLCELQTPQSLTKDHYLRAAPIIPDQCEPGFVLDSPGFCYSECRDDTFQGVGPVCWNKELGQSIALIFAGTPILGLNSAVCSAILLPQIIANLAVFLADPERASNDLEHAKVLDYSSCMRPFLAVANAIDSEWSINSVTVAFEISVSESLFSGIFESKPFEMQNGHSFMIGIAFNFPKPTEMNIYIYHGQCEFTTADVGSVGISIAQVIHRSPEDIKGKETYFSIGVDLESIIKVPIGITGSYAFNEDCEVTSMAQAIEISAGGLGSPLILEGGVCLVKDETYSRVFTTEEELDECRLTIVSNDHKWWPGEKIGQYFAIDLDKADCILGSNLVDGSVMNVYYSGSNEIRSVKLWRDNNMNTPNTGANYGHGRKNNDNNNGDWEVGEYIKFDGVTCNAECLK